LVFWFDRVLCFFEKVFEGLWAGILSNRGGSRKRDWEAMRTNIVFCSMPSENTALRIIKMAQK
jgi:hypothetical protein